MKYCVHCGAEMFDEAVFCVKCGCQAGTTNIKSVAKTQDDTMNTVIKVFMIIGCVTMGWCIIPLAWCIPMTVHLFKALNEGRPVSTGFKICTLIFVSMVSGICLLCKHDEAL